MSTVKLEIVNGEETRLVEVAKGTRLVNAIEANGVDILHRCGGNARCTTCKVAFVSGAPASITEAEKGKLAESGLAGTARLSCQIQCNQDMTVRVLGTVTSTGMSDAGGAPSASITPEPVWV